MGGLWADALGEKYDARNEGIDARCREVAPDYEKAMHAIDPTAVDRVAQRVGDRDLVALTRKIADAARETMQARLAADQVKEDAAKTGAPDTYAADKNAAAPLLSRGDAMRALLDDKGPHADAAHALGVMVALDRMAIARGLPKHLKIEVAGPAYDAVFGVKPPPVSGAPADRAPRGEWLAYLTDVAAAAQHAVPATVGALPDREMLAWASVLEGFADKLRAMPAFKQNDGVGDVARKIVVRLDAEWKDAQALIAAKH